jgi:hypothetical protein
MICCKTRFNSDWVINAVSTHDYEQGDSLRQLNSARISYYARPGDCVIQDLINEGVTTKNYFRNLQALPSLP